MKLRSCFLALSVFAAVLLNAQNPPLSADRVLKEATVLAAREGKNVIIIFHASWCGWCHKMDSSMNDKGCKKFFDDNYIIRHLVVHESKGKKNLENPGADKMLLKYAGADSGIPFWLVFDKDGNLLADSQIRPDGAGLDTKGQNSGCPAQPEEVDYFLMVLKKTSSITHEQSEAIRKRFRMNAN